MTNTSFLYAMNLQMAVLVTYVISTSILNDEWQAYNVNGAEWKQVQLLSFKILHENEMCWIHLYKWMDLHTVPR
jgi:hypothetical protein